MNILLTNDDGIYSPGLEAIYNELKKFAKVTIISPIGERSAIGMGITIFREIEVKKISKNGAFYGYAISGTPVDCVKLGITTLCKEKIDLVVSGINNGQNVGTSVLYSGTVAAAMEGLLYGIPSVAISRCFGNDLDFRFAAKFSSKLIKEIHKNGLPRGIMLNVNIPSISEKEIQGIEICPQGNAMYEDLYKLKNDLDDVIIYENYGELVKNKSKDFNDDAVLDNKKISITPLYYNLTHFESIEDLRKWDLETLI